MITTRRSLAVAGILWCLLASSWGGIAGRASPARWEARRFLLGTWVATGANQLGTADGATSFTEELNGHIIVRRNVAAYTGGAAAGTRHDDLLVMYRDPADSPPRAIYFDSEGHVIRYEITQGGANAATFQSEPSQQGPRYRLTYTRSGATLSGIFAIAGAGTQDYKT